ncbi:MAG TPA: hypothetical protein VHT92_11185 [Candidatus Cybelea sp.]|jgi:hypothetical protein|nr:hypothetical protein [Candidatus Cybelea sp.]
MLRLALIFAAVLVAYDALAAVIARAIGISYDSFAVLSLVVIFFMGVYAGRKQRGRGIIVIAIVAAVEATVGWYLASLIGPGYVPGWTMRVLVVMGVEAWLLSAAVGLAGVGIGMRVAGLRRRSF